MSCNTVIPEPFDSLEQALRHVTGKDIKVRDRQTLSGGDINRVWKLTLDDNSHYFLKENSSQNLPLFTSEYRALKEMIRVGEIGIPDPLAFGREGRNAFLLLPYLKKSAPVLDYWQDFGRSFARFHKEGKGERFGFYEDNFIGAIPQPNPWSSGWVDFFREQRLEHQIRLASTHLNGEISRRLIWFLDRLENYLPEPEAPSLLHGDLWSGNVYTGPDGKAWIIDPAAYYGHPEADLAMTELFGSQPESFYRSYSEINPIDREYRERRDIYNLYHLFNHLNMFGQSYLGSVKAVIDRFS